MRGLVTLSSPQSAQCGLVLDVDCPCCACVVPSLQVAVECDVRFELLGRRCYHLVPSALVKRKNVLVVRVACAVCGLQVELRYTGCDPSLVHGGCVVCFSVAASEELDLSSTVIVMVVDVLDHNFDKRRAYRLRQRKRLHCAGVLEREPLGVAVRKFHTDPAVAP